MKAQHLRPQALYSFGRLTETVMFTNIVGGWPMGRSPGDEACTAIGAAVRAASDSVVRHEESGRALATKPEEAAGVLAEHANYAAQFGFSPHGLTWRGGGIAFEDPDAPRLGGPLPGRVLLSNDVRWQDPSSTAGCLKYSLPD